MTPNECRAARALLGMSQRQLGISAGVDADSTRRFENQPATVSHRTVEKLKAQLQALGIIFSRTRTARGVRLTSWKAKKGQTGIEPLQIIAGRALLFWSQIDLGNAAGLNIASIKKFEHSLDRGHRFTLEQIVRTLRSAGIEFVAGGGVLLAIEKHQGKQPIPRAIGEVVRMTNSECKAARSLLGMSQGDFARIARVGLSSVVEFETRRRNISSLVAICMQEALEKLGVEFIKISDATGVRLSSEIGNRTIGIDARQLKAARALLDWSQHELADASGLAFETVRRIENGESSYTTTLEQILNTLRRYRVELIDGAGVVRRIVN